MGLKASVLSGPLLLLYITQTVSGAFVRPNIHTLPSGLQSLSGSDSNGGCAAGCVIDGVCQCSGNVQTNSTLIDGVCPSGVIDTQQSNWASDFFTINRNGDSLVRIGFDWNSGFELQGVELKLFNCESEGTAIHTINVYASISFPALTPLVDPPGPVGSYLTAVNDLDCTRVTTIVIPTTPITVRNYILEFSFPEEDSNTGIYIAEVRFSDTTITTPSEVSSTPPLPSATTTVEQVTTTPSIPVTTIVEQVTSSSPLLPPPSSSTISSSVPPLASTSPTASAMLPPVEQNTSTTMAPTSTVSSDVMTMITSTISTPDTFTAMNQISTTPPPTPNTPPPSTTAPTPNTPPPSTIAPTPDSPPPSTTADTTSNPPAINTDQGLGAIIGPLVGVIIVLILVIMIGIVITAVCLSKNRQKKGDFDVRESRPQLNGGTIEMDALRRSFANNQYYEETLHTQSRGGTSVGGGYFEISLNSSTEPLYHCVNNERSQVETVDDNKIEEEHYANFKETNDSNLNKLPPYSKVNLEAPPIPKKTPDLYRALTLERESLNSIPSLVVMNENEEEVERVDNYGDSENAYQLVDSVEKSASIHSGLAVLTKPVLSMDSNPTYESPDAALLDKSLELNEIYTNPDALDGDRELPASEGALLVNRGPPVKPTRTHQAILEKQDAEGIYSDPDKDSAPLKAATPSIEENDELIYTDPDALTVPTTLVRTKDETYTNKNTVLTDEDIYSDADRENLADMLPAIYDSIYQDAAVASIFDPDSISPTYENTISDDELFPYAPIYVDSATLDIAPLELTVDNIHMLKTLGSGCFGQVMLAETVGLSPKDLKTSKTDDDKTKSVLVAVKTLKSTASSTTREAFDKECKFMSKLNHPHVIRFLGVCKDPTPYIMMEYLKYGDLNQYLEENFDTIVDFESDNPREISVEALIDMCKQISDAMSYLASHNYIHRDLAARNCLVGESNIIKLSDFGMSRSLYESHYYIIKGRAILPVRWMSTECFYGKFSVNSDVWAFGVTMWEIFTLAKKLPYEDLSDSEVAQDALERQKRRLLTKPESCPQEVFAIIRKCWAHEPRARAKFHELYDDLCSLTETSEDDECV